MTTEAITVSETDRKFLDALAEPMTCAQVGSQVWNDQPHGVGRMPQSYCRPAGRVIARLVKAGFVSGVHDEHGRRKYVTIRRPA